MCENLNSVHDFLSSELLLSNPDWGSPLDVLLLCEDMTAYVCYKPFCELSQVQLRTMLHSQPNAQHLTNTNTGKPGQLSRIPKSGQEIKTASIRLGLVCLLVCQYLSLSTTFVFVLLWLWCLSLNRQRQPSNPYHDTTERPFIEKCPLSFLPSSSSTETEAETADSFADQQTR